MPESPSIDDGGSGDDAILTYFSTVRDERSRRTAAMMDFVSDAILPASLTSSSRDGAVVSLRHLRVGRVVAAEGVHNKVLIERSPGAIAAHRSDTMMLIVLLDGTSFHRHRSERITLSAGDALLCDSDVPGLQGYSHGSRVLVLRAARSAFVAQTGRSHLLRPYLMRGLLPSIEATSHDDSLRRIRGALRQSSPATGIADDVLHLLEFAHAGTSTGALRYVQAAREFIEDRLADPSLNVGAVAQALSVSERQLARSFAAEGTGVAATITELRLQRARLLLTEQSPQRYSIGAVGAAVGFASPSSFAHVYRRRFGRSLREERMAARPAAAAISEDRLAPFPVAAGPDAVTTG